MFTLRNCQVEALKAIENNSIGIVDMCCGAGKTLVIAETCKKYKTSIVFVPKNMLFEQFKNNPIFNDFELISINCNNTPDEIKGGKPVIIFTNAHSFHVLKKYVNFDIDFIAYDEAHLYTYKIVDETEETSSEEEETPEGLLDCFNPKKRIFFTATPNGKMLKNPEVFGGRIFTYSYAQGVRDGIVLPIQTVFGFTKMNLNEPVKIEDMYATYGKFLLNSIKEFNLKRIIVYCSNVNINASKNFRTEVLRFAQGLKNRKEIIHIVTGSSSINERNKIIDSMNSNEDNVQILLSCDTISEGIDIPGCDAVFLADPSKSIPRNVQRILRCCRLFPGKEKGLILIPLFINPDELKQYAETEQQRQFVKENTRGHQFEYIQAIITCLKTNMELDLFFEYEAPNVKPLLIENAQQKQRTTRRNELLNKKEELILEKQVVEEKLLELQKQPETPEVLVEIKETEEKLQSVTENLEEVTKELEGLVTLQKESSKVVIKFFDDFNLSIEDTDILNDNLFVNSKLIKIDQEKSLRNFYEVENRKPMKHIKNSRDYLGLTEAQLSNMITLVNGKQKCNQFLIPVLKEFVLYKGNDDIDKISVINDFYLKENKKLPNAKSGNKKLYLGFTEKTISSWVTGCRANTSNKDLQPHLEKIGWFNLTLKDIFKKNQIEDIYSFYKKNNRIPLSKNKPKNEQEKLEHKLAVQFYRCKNHGSNQHLKPHYIELGWAIEEDFKW